MTETGLLHTNDSGKWILITGGTGFIGFALVKRLISLGHRVRVFTRSMEFDRDFEQYVSVTPESNLEVIVGDIRNKDSLRNAFRDVDVVIHSAAMLNTVAPVKEFREANVTSTRNICELCQEFKVSRLVYVSTCDVFGLPQKDKVFSESSPYRPWSEPYADTKIEASQLVKEFGQGELNYTIIYSGWVYGPGDKAFMPSLIEQMQSGIMPVWDGGKYKIAMVYIDDIIDAFILALSKKESLNEDFLILDDAPRMNMEAICRYLGQLFNLKFRIIRLPYWLAFIIAWTSQSFVKLGLFKQPIMSTTDAKSLGLNFKYSTEKARRLLGWSSKEDPESGLSKWKEWYDLYT
jgi:nucleoside-diphosphate-sugar epimerase